MKELNNNSSVGHKDQPFYELSWQIIRWALGEVNGRLNAYLLKKLLALYLNNTQVLLACPIYSSRGQ